MSTTAYSSSWKKGSKVWRWALLLMMTVAALSISCSSNGCFNRPSPKKVAVGVPLEPSNLNPLLELNNEAKQITSLVFDGLTNPMDLSGNLSQEYTNVLAQRIIEINPNDRRFLRVELRPGVKWHNGVDFTAGDVYFTWEAIHQSNSPLRVRLDRFIEELRVDDNLSLMIKLREERIAEKVNDIISFKIVPQVYDPAQGRLPKNLRAAAANQFNWKPVGTGPYKIADRPSGAEIILAANPLPALGAAPKIKTVQVKRYPGWDVIAKALSDRSVNLAVDVPPNFFEQLEQKNLSKQVYSPYNFYALVYNVTSAPLNDRNFRRALNHASDRVQLASAFLPDEPNVTQYLNESIYPHNYVHVQDTAAGYATQVGYDPEKARQLLAGFSQNQKRLSLLYSSLLDGENANFLAQAYRQMMAQVGVDVILENAPNISSYYSSLQTQRFQVAFVLYDELDHFYDLYEFFEPRAPKNHSGFVNPQLTDKLSELKLTLAFDDVGRITREIHKIIDDNAPVCPLFTLPKRAYYSPNLHNLTINPENYFNLFYLADIL